MTGFNGRCDCIYLTESDREPGDPEDLRRRLNWKEVQEDPEVYDLIVAGGGVAGVCTALAAMRSGVNALLLHDRGVLGGCNSSEIRVCMGGMANLPPYPRIGDVLKEIAPVMGHPTRFKGEYYEDHRKLFAFETSKKQHRVKLNECVTALETDTTPMAEIYATRRAYVCRRLDEMGLTYPEPKGAFYVFPNIEKYGMTSAEFCTRMIREAGVATVPGSCFGTEGHIRISYCCSDEALEKGLSRMEAFLKTL